MSALAPPSVILVARRLRTCPAKDLRESCKSYPCADFESATPAAPGGGPAVPLPDSASVNRNGTVPHCRKRPPLERCAQLPGQSRSPCLLGSATARPAPNRIHDRSPRPALVEESPRWVFVNWW